MFRTSLLFFVLSDSCIRPQIPQDNGRIPKGILTNLLPQGMGAKGCTLCRSKKPIIKEEHHGHREERKEKHAFIRYYPPEEGSCAQRTIICMNSKKLTITGNKRWTLEYGAITLICSDDGIGWTYYDTVSMPDLVENVTTYQCD